MLSVTLGSLSDVEVPGGKSVLVPLNGVDSGGGAVTYSFSSTDPGIQVSLVSPTSKSLSIVVDGTDKDGNEFDGTLVLKLFDDLAPVTTARIEQLVGSSYYNGLDFFRILDGFVAQTGNNGAGDTGQSFSDEFNSSLTFTSPGLLAMANAGRDTNDAEFFITAIDKAGTTTPVALADMHQELNFKYTIFGQLVSGFDTFEKIMSTTVAENSDQTEDSVPVNSIRIISASLIDDPQHAVLMVSAPASLDGTVQSITVTATNSAQESAQTSLVATIETDSTIDPPFLGSVSNQTVDAGNAESFSLSSTDLSAKGVAYTVVDPTTFAAPTNVTVSVNQTSGLVTLTPKAGFTGTINLLAGVRPASAQDVKDSYDTQAFTLTVNPGSDSGGGDTPAAPSELAVNSPDPGSLDSEGYVSTATPTLTATAESGATVQFTVNGAVVATGAETAAGSGEYSATIPAGTLAVGANSVTAKVTDASGASPDSTAMSFVYAPDYSSGVYVVPGGPGTSQTLTFDWTSKNASYNNEFGFFIVNSADGSIGGVAPGQAGYAQAALSSSTKQVIFSKGQKAGATINVTLEGGQMIVFYLIQNNTTANFLSQNPNDTISRNNNGSAPLAFFSLEAANPDSKRHAQIIADSSTGDVQYNWEDLINLGDADFNDSVISAHLSTATAQSATLHAPGTGDGNVTLSATLKSEKQSTPDGDVGVFYVDSPDGAIGTLHPGDAGYVAAALATENFQVLFGSGASGSKSISVPTGKYLAFFAITSGTVDNFLTSNPTNSSSGPSALFSFDSANSDTANHFRWYTPRQQSTDPNATELHVMTKLNGKADDFDSFALDLTFTE